MTWVNPIKASVMHDFVAANPHELNLRAGQSILIAPREIQNTQKLIGTGWILASLDNQTSGLIPINYITGPKQMSANAFDQQHQSAIVAPNSQILFNDIGGETPLDINYT